MWRRIIASATNTIVVGVSLDGQRLLVGKIVKGARPPTSGIRVILNGVAVLSGQLAPQAP